MFFASYRADNGQTRVATLHDGQYYDLRSIDSKVPTDMIELLVAYESLSAALKEKLLWAKNSLRPLDLEKLLPPIRNPGKLLCLGLNYHDHAAEMDAPLPKYPDIFAKFSNTLIGSGSEISMPDQSKQLDYEVELAVVIGRECRNVRCSEAPSFIAGYTILNDVSVRDFQLRSSQATMGKNFDTHGPCGPVIATTDEIPDPQRLRLYLRVNGEVRQESSTEKMIFPVIELVEYISSVMTLSPGDMISTGTPSGTGISRTPALWLQRGDHIEAEIESIGRLSNTVA